ncbi:MAG: hypothetical protein CL387_07005 [Acidiferrobacter sp.]|mgnify:CR=1 FL=1|nr:hypothetical protein [Acidiferrobacter sp.]
MAQLPLAVNVQGDYGYKVIVVEEENTIEEVIQVAVDQIVGVLVAPFPEGTKLCAKVHGAQEPLDNSLTVSDAKFIQMEALQIYAEP